MKDQDVNVRRFSAIALGKIGLEAKDVALALTSALKDQDINVRSYAAKALGQQVAGPVAKQAILVLIQSLKGTPISSVGQSQTWHSICTFQGLTCLSSPLVLSHPLLLSFKPTGGISCTSMFSPMLSHHSGFFFNKF